MLFICEGPGVWELRAHGIHRDKKKSVTATLKAIPTPTHMSFVKLEKVRVYIGHFRFACADLFFLNRREY